MRSKNEKQVLNDFEILGEQGMRIIRLPELAKIMGLSVFTVQGWSSKHPEKLPPKFQKFGKGNFWLLRDVWFWLGAIDRQAEPGAAGASPAPEVPKPGRGCPSKVERDAAKAAGMTVKQFRRSQTQMQTGGIENAPG